VFPIFAVILPQTATEFLSDQVFITGRLFDIARFRARPGFARRAGRRDHQSHQPDRRRA
jgi:hypothetical protein